MHFAHIFELGKQSVFFLKEIDATCSSKIVKDALVNCLLFTNLCESRQESGKQKVAKKSSGETARPEVISLGFLL